MRSFILAAALAFVASAASAQTGFTPQAEAALERTEGPRIKKPFVTLEHAKELFLANRSRLWKDPASVREASVSEPFVCTTGRGTCFCIEANAKNVYGGYSGLGKYGVEFTKPESFGLLGALGPYIKCGKMIPFPEMNGS